MRRLRPFFGYYGSKWILAPHYPAPLHRRVVEPFAGSACYSLLHWRREVTLVDAYPVVAGIWRYLISVSAEEILALPDLADGQTVGDLDVCQEARWLIGLWIRSAQVVVCEAEGADWLPFRALRSVRSAASQGRVGRSAEAIWTRDT